MSEPFPLLVGVTGKRVFSSDAQKNDRISESVKRRLRATFAWLDAKYPGTPKALLSGGALGADLLAAEAALEQGPTWSVMLVLPYAQDLFRKDFPAGSPDLQRFDAIMARTDSPRVMMKELPALLTAGPRVVTYTELDKDDPKHDKVLRRRHYEQVGQFIAETAMVLIAVMDPETRPETENANGATARVVAFRRAGTADRAGAAVRADSRLLERSVNKLLLPPAGHVWLITPEDRAPQSGLAIRVLPPLTDRPADQVYAGQPGRDMPQGDSHDDFIDRAWARAADWMQDRYDAIRCQSTHGMRGKARQHLNASLRLAFAFDRFHRLRAPVTDQTGATTEPSRKIEDLQAELALLRKPIGTVQQTIKSRATVCLVSVAILFVLAVGILESFAKLFATQDLMIVGYVVVLTLIGIVVVCVRRCRWQTLAEDYRSVSEILRVQRSWWAAELPDRADHVHLRGADRDLSGSRDAARSILNWVWLRSDWPTAQPRMPNWSVVRDQSWQGISSPRPTDRLTGTPPSNTLGDWIGSQISYYARNHEKRERQVQLSDSLTWTLFIGSGLLAAILALLLHSQSLQLSLFTSVSGPCRELTAVGWLLLAVAALVTRQSLRHRPGLLHSMQNWVFAIVGALCASVGLAALVAPAAVIDPFQADAVQLAKGATSDLKKPLIVTFVVLTAIAGAIRFVTEKLGLEAEALAYRDALGKFERAERLLAQNWDAATNAPIDRQAAQALVRELGEQALRENETWLRAHRERPLSPVIG